MHNQNDSTCVICCTQISEDLVACSAGHACCQQCFRNYAKSALSGTGKITLPCMIDRDCKGGYSRAVKEWILTDDQLKLLDEREQNESIRLANIEDLNYCIFCNTPAIVTEQELVLYCSGCKKSSCIKCKIDWLNHKGACDEIQRKKEKTADVLRHKYEEKMTDLKVVKCPQCSVPSIKSSGCNHMTCQDCNTDYCYVCKKGIEDIYKHFCGCDNYFNEEKSTCTRCGSCFMFGDKDTEVDENIESLQRHAAKIQKKRGLRRQAVGVTDNETWSRHLNENVHEEIDDSDLDISDDDYEQEPVYKFTDFNGFLLEERNMQRDILTGKRKYQSQPHKISEKLVDEVLDFQNVLQEWIFD